MHRLKLILLARKAILSLVVLSQITILSAQTTLWDTIPTGKTTVSIPKTQQFFIPEMNRISYEVQNAKNIDVLFIGSSIVHRWKNADKGLPVWNEYLVDKGIRGVISGMCYDRLENTLYRNINGNLGFKEGEAPKVAVCLFGQKNIEKEETAQEIADGIRANVQLVRRHLPDTRIILTGLLPVYKEGGVKVNATMLKKVREINNIIGKYEEADRVAFVDCSNKFVNNDGKSINKELITKDGSLITTAGYRIWMESINKKLNEFLRTPVRKSIRIMPLGNSITSTLSDNECYRRFLDTKLHQTGLKFDFVGSRHWLRNESRRPEKYDYDYDHEGHWSKEADWILPRVGNYARNYKPDLVMLHIGTNDVLHEQGTLNEIVEQTLKDIGNIIDTLRAVNPNIKILLAKIIPTKRGGLIDKKIATLDSKLPHLAAMKNSIVSPIVIVDQWTGIVPKEDLHDAYHVNHSGAIKMYRKWFAGIQEILKYRSVEATQIKLPNVLGNNMVLQRNSTTPIWGTGKPGQQFSIYTSWNGQEYPIKVNNNGEWRINTTTGEAGGPYKIEIRSDSIISLNNILLGEVWLCSGQSNMQMALRGSYGSTTEGSAAEIASANNPNIRLFTVGRTNSRQPKTECRGNWKECSPGAAAAFSATGWFFGNYLQKSLGIPVGLIQSAVGGTPAQAWTPEEYLKDFDKDDVMSNFEKHKYKSQYPAVLYNAMINPIVKYKIKGAIWYQGESNAIRPYFYYKLFPKMIEAWRDKWGYRFPFYFVQIAPFGSSDKIDGAIIRDAQLYSMKTVINSGMVVTLDVGEQRNIHPSKKREVGERLAFWALANTYARNGVPYTAPVYDNIEIKDSTVIVKFRLAGHGFINTRKNIAGFEIAGADHIFYPAKAQRRRDGKSVNVWTDKVKKPVAVRYGFHNWTEASLFGINGLPVSSFRSDDWIE
jgi:sialate O-acetylesterase